MAQQGGYRKPTNPAPVSGPGKLSKRTDGGPGDTKQNQVKITGMGYGENKDLNQIQSEAPLAAAPGVPATQAIPTTPLPQPTPLTAPTERPAEPVSAGMPFGPGVNALPSVPAEQVNNSDDKQRALVVLGMLQNAYNQGDNSQGTINLIRQLRSEI